MSADYRVVLSDLADMATTFTGEATTYEQLVAQITPPTADSGDAGLNQTIQDVMQIIAALHVKMADRLRENGAKLQYAHDSYQRNDVDVHGVFGDLMGG